METMGVREALRKELERMTDAEVREFILKEGFDARAGVTRQIGGDRR
jgi:hypothetical protein